MKSIYQCPSCGAKTLEWNFPAARMEFESVKTFGELHCENTRCTSKATADGVEAGTEEKALELLREAVRKVNKVPYHILEGELELLRNFVAETQKRNRKQQGNNRKYDPMWGFVECQQKLMAEIEERK